MKQLTISLDDDLYAMARDHAAALRTSLSEAISDLLRRRVPVPAAAEAPSIEKDRPSYFISPLTGLEMSYGRGALTMEDIARAEEDDDRYHAEAGGYKREERPVP